MLRVNGELIDPNLLEDAFARIKSEAEARLQVSCCERDPEFMAQAEEEVIDSVLIAQEAETRFPELPETERALALLQSEYGYTRETALEAVGMLLRARYEATS